MYGNAYVYVPTVEHQRISQIFARIFIFCFFPRNIKRQIIQFDTVDAFLEEVGEEKEKL